MEKQTKQLIIIGTIITFIIVPVVATLIITKMSPAPDTSIPVVETPLAVRSNDELKQAIQADKPELTADNKPTFMISNSKNPQRGWYIVTIHLTDDPEGTNPARILMYDYGKDGGIQIVLGPGTDFSPETTEARGIPDAVAKELNS
jgi:hypothetical protein